MLLNEFFGKGVDVNKDLRKHRDDDNMNNELFWFIIDHDRLQKDYFFPIAKKIYKAYNAKKLDKAQAIKDFYPMVKKGCQEFYQYKKMPGHFEDTFDKKLMKEMCERLFDHYREDIIRGEYKLGD